MQGGPTRSACVLEMSMLRKLRVDHELDVLADAVRQPGSCWRTTPTVASSGSPTASRSPGPWSPTLALLVSRLELIRRVTSGAVDPALVLADHNRFEGPILPEERDALTMQVWTATTTASSPAKSTGKEAKRGRRRG